MKDKHIGILINLLINKLDDEPSQLNLRSHLQEYINEHVEKNLFIIRGLPSSGKTTFAEKICKNVVSADNYFEQDGGYNFDATKLGVAHRYCQDMTEEYMKIGKDIAVTNTFTTEKEMKPYFELADKYGYTVTTVVMESRHGNKNTHNVPVETIEKMRNRFSINL